MLALDNAALANTLLAIQIILLFAFFDPRDYWRYNRSYRLRRNGGKHTAADWELIKRRANYRCSCCQGKKPLTKDHIIPVSRGGRDSIDNLQALCQSCNSSKGARIIDYR